MYDKIWDYIAERYDNDGILPDADEIYLAFQMEFDNGADVWAIDEVVEDFASCSDLTGIEIRWEGELNVPSFGGTTKELEISQAPA